ncbi:unnamed protein product [Rhizoctonia solani]|uniref:Uncharacterized protein n=1 Tax=Rhizoctonia solani TaxID=456999 RepID=A0A8H3B022_9AGAM|nr:unnamed protein product [Rhizoctonia solani]
MSYDYLTSYFASRNVAITGQSCWTGLFPESHGIIANEFIEPDTGAHFFYQHPDESRDADWWGGEPMWETAVKAGLKTANLMWPGPPVTRNGHKPTHFIPFRINMSLQDKSDQILNWIDLPFDERPQLITMYEPMIDDVGHHHGPDSPQMTDALMNIDVFAHSVRAGLSSRNLSSIVDVIFLSDHGMAPTHDRKWIYLDDILGEEGADEIDWKLGQPSAGLWFHPGANVTRHLEKLYRAAARPPHNFKVYTATSDVWPNVYNGVEIPPGLQNPFPPHKHFSPDHNSRIPPIYVVPELGCGPFTDRVRAQVFAQAQAQPATISPASNRFTRTSPAPAIYAPQTHNTTSKPPIYVPPRGGGNGPVLIDKFQNVEVYASN